MNCDERKSNKSKKYLIGAMIAFLLLLLVVILLYTGDKKGSSANNAAVVHNAPGAPISVEDAWYEDASGGNYSLYLFVRNTSRNKFYDTTLYVDVLNDSGDILTSGYAVFGNILDRGQACTVNTYLQKSEIGNPPSQIRISQVGITDIKDEYNISIIDPAIEIENIRKGKFPETDTSDDTNGSETNISSGSSESSTKNHESNYTEAEIKKYQLVIKAYNKIYNSVKNPASLTIYGIRLHDEDTVVIRFTATNGYGGTVTDYAAYSGGEILFDCQVMYKGEEIKWEDVIAYNETLK